MGSPERTKVRAFQLNRDGIDLKQGLQLTIVIFCPVIVLGYFFGTVGIIAGLAALFAMLSDFKGPLRSRLKLLGSFTLIGTAITVIAGITGPYMWLVVLSVLIFAFACTLLQAYGSHMGKMMYLLILWFLMAYLFGYTPYDTRSTAFGFLIGSLASICYIVLVSLFSRKKRPKAQGTAPLNQQGNATAGGIRVQLNWNSPIFRFAVVRSVLLSIAIIIGWKLFPTEAYWVAITILVIIKEDPHQIIVSGVERATGTLLGAVIAISILGLFSDPLISLLVFLLALFLMFSFRLVNYAIFVFFMTIMLMSTIAIGGSDVTTGGIVRFLAVTSGVALAFLGIGIITLISHKKKHSGVYSSG